METISTNFNELETQFILRLPVSKDGTIHPAAVELKEILTNGTNNLKERLFIDLNLETRKGSVRFDNNTFKARLVDLPCIIESLKTIDKKTFYKTNDLSQMLICKLNDDEDNSDNSSSDEKKEEKVDVSNANDEEINKKHQWLHGITPPLKNVRKKRFRKVAKKKIIDYAEIEKEVKQLFRKDRDAIKVDYEVLYVDDPHQSQDDNDTSKKHNSKKKDLKKKMAQFDALLGDDSTLNNIDLNSPATQADSSSNDATTSKGNKNQGNKSDFVVEQVIGDLSSSSESDTELGQLFSMDTNNRRSAAKISNINSCNDSFNDTNNQNSFEQMDIGDESTNLDAPMSVDANRHSFSAQNEDSNTNFFEQNSNANNQDEIIGNLTSSDDSLSRSSSPASDKINIDELKIKITKLNEELNEIKARRKKQEEEINQINNPVLKGRLLPMLNDLIEDEKQKSIEIEEIESLLNELN